MTLLKLPDDVWGRLGLNWRIVINYRAVMRRKNALKTQKTWWQILRLGMNCGLIGLS